MSVYIFHGFFFWPAVAAAEEYIVQGSHTGTSSISI
jgi:hypothetical protein